MFRYVDQVFDGTVFLDITKKFRCNEDQILRARNGKLCYLAVYRRAYSEGLHPVHHRRKICLFELQGDLPGIACHAVLSTEVRHHDVVNIPRCSVDKGESPMRQASTLRCQ